MKFILVNGRTPCPQSFCTLCCEPIGETYLREIATQLSYCDHQCYRGHCRISAPRTQPNDAAGTLMLVPATP
jgi:hypothetical protein